MSIWSWLTTLWRRVHPLRPRCLTCGHLPASHRWQNVAYEALPDGQEWVVRAPHCDGDNGSCLCGVYTLVEGWTMIPGSTSGIYGPMKPQSRIRL